MISFHDGVLRVTGEDREILADLAARHRMTPEQYIRALVDLGFVELSDDVEPPAAP